jgi:hypothetical protein
MVKTTVRFEDTVYLAARHRALDERITFQELVERAVQIYLKSKPRKEPKSESK